MDDMGKVAGPHNETAEYVQYACGQNWGNVAKTDDFRPSSSVPLQNDPKGTTSRPQRPRGSETSVVQMRKDGESQNEFG